MRRLTDEQVIEMRAQYPGKTTRELAAEYKIDQENIRKAISGIAYSHLPGAKPITRIRSGRLPRLTKEQVNYIRSTYPRKTQRQLAYEMGISASLINRIILRRQYKDIE
jgi:hypothetical protein